MSIGYYITAHGYGHAVRSLAIINQLPPSIPVLIRSEVSQSFLDQELRRDASRHSKSFDCGAVQTDAVNVDIAATLGRYAEIHAANLDAMENELRFLHDHAIRLVVSDVPSFPLVVAKAAKLPAFVVSNFTWADIYQPYTIQFPQYAGLLGDLEEEYRQATCGLILPFHLPMYSVPNHKSVGLVCRESGDIRPELAMYHNIDADKRWVLVYIGQGETAFDWDRLARDTQTIYFVLGRETLDRKNFVAAEPNRFGGQNIVKACDLVIAKPGYGIVADCVASGTPLLYSPRVDFAESMALQEGLEEWGGGFMIDSQDFYRGDLITAIHQACAKCGKTSLSLNGASEVAEILTDQWRQ